MTDATIGFGTKLRRGDGANPEVFTDVAEVLDVTGPGLTMSTVEATHQASPNAWREYIAGLKDGGEVTFDVNFLPANVTMNVTAGLLKDFDDRKLRNWEVVFPDTGATKWAFAALITGVEPSNPVDDKSMASITLKLSGKPTLA